MVCNSGVGWGWQKGSFVWNAQSKTDARGRREKNVRFGTEEVCKQEEQPGMKVRQ